MALGQDATLSGQSKIYLKQQPVGQTLNGSAVATEEVVDVGGLVNQYGISALNGVIMPNKVVFTIAAGAANITNVNIKVVDNAGNFVAQPWHFDVQLSDSALGGGLTATTASGAVGAGVKGIVLNTYTAKKAIYVECDQPTGQFDLSITDTGKTGFFVQVQAPNGFPNVSRQLVAGDYG